MTLYHLIRAAIVAGLAIGVLAVATQAQAEGGDTSVEARTGSAPSVQPEAPAEAQASPGLGVSLALPGADGEARRASRSARGRSARAPETAGSTAASASIQAMIARHAAAHGVPAALADAMVRIESRYNPGARNGPNVGLTQINPRTARGLGFQGSTAALMDPDTNLNYGIKYLALAYRLAGGDLCGTVLRYQAGHGARSMTGAARAYCAKARTILASR